MDELENALTDRVDGLLQSHKEREFVSTMGTQATLGELTARIVGLELAVRELANELQQAVIRDRS
ncbi:MAG: hypothetical protein H0X39_01590 [Actinobacteria bacterium]|nr:hypothetical protein [Actinomycetota bacterium]